jgi:hypothetical protein
MGFVEVDVSIGSWRDICRRRGQAQRTPAEVLSIGEFIEALQMREAGCFDQDGGRDSSPQRQRNGQAGLGGHRWTDGSDGDKRR